MTPAPIDRDPLDPDADETPPRSLERAVAALAATMRGHISTCGDRHRDFARRFDRAEDEGTRHRDEMRREHQRLARDLKQAIAELDMKQSASVRRIYGLLWKAAFIVIGTLLGALGAAYYFGIWSQRVSEQLKINWPF